MCRRGRIRRLKQLLSLRTPCLLSAPWHSKRSLLLFPPWHSPSLEQHGRHVQIPKHSSIRTFWLLTRPQKMVDMCCLQGARQDFSHVTLSLSLKWEITLRNRLADALWDSLLCVHTKSHRQLLTLVKRSVTYIACIHQNTYMLQGWFNWQLYFIHSDTISTKQNSTKSVYKYHTSECIWYFWRAEIHPSESGFLMYTAVITTWGKR